MGQTIKNVLFSTSFTRPANTTQYAVDDSVNDGTTNALSFSTADGITVSLGSSYFVKTARLVTNNTTVTSGSFRLWLYDSSVSAIADNSIQTLLWANRSKRVGYIDFVLQSSPTGSDCAEAVVVDSNLSIRMEATTLYGLLTTKGTYTPASGQLFYIELNIQQLDA